MKGISPAAHLGTDALMMMAQKETRKTQQEDQKLSAQSRDIHFDAQVRAKEVAAQREKDKANNEAAAEKKKSTGGLFGSIFAMIFLAIACVAACCVPGGALVVAAVLGIGAAAAAASTAGGAAAGAAAAKGDQDKAADNAKEAADLNLEATRREKKSQEEKAKADEARESYKQMLQDARTLNQGRKEAFDATRLKS